LIPLSLPMWRLKVRPEDKGVLVAAETLSQACAAFSSGQGPLPGYAERVGAVKFPEVRR
jgi:hypothetical protein